ncbi:MAG TPA: hypothetical protein DCG30_03865 [Ruminococcus sp.]|nr:hypothetical protein [Ruminococcus sp.]
MKKNKKTAATAAMFATALNMALGSVTPDTVPTLSVKADEPDYEPSAEYVEEVYGPPEFFSTTATEDAYDPATETETTMAVVYGPPSMMTTEYDPYGNENPAVYGPPSFFAKGDVNWDGSTDVFDLIRLRQVYSNSQTVDLNYGYSEYDVNLDGRLSIADLVALNRFLLGRSTNLDWYYDSEEEPVPQPDYGPPYEPIEQPEYGPPVDYDEDEDKPVTTTMMPDNISEETTTATYPVYGPPIAFD